ncbi:MAG: hypothetical protein AAFX86_13960 [Pseudomonadota bacterium]
MTPDLRVTAPPGPCAGDADVAIFDQRGLMAGVFIEVTKITKVEE